MRTEFSCVGTGRGKQSGDRSELNFEVGLGPRSRYSSVEDVKKPIEHCGNVGNQFHQRFGVGEKSVVVSQTWGPKEDGCDVAVGLIIIAAECRDASEK